MHYVDLYWLVMPSLQLEGFQPHWLDAAAFIGVGGVFIAGLVRLMAKPALIPSRDPRLGESLSFENI
jgi:hypothetical protein